LVNPRDEAPLGKHRQKIEGSYDGKKALLKNMKNDPPVQISLAFRMPCPLLRRNFTE
jgi:hypothetical protein